MTIQLCRFKRMLFGITEVENRDSLNPCYSIRSDHFIWFVSDRIRADDRCRAKRKQFTNARLELLVTRVPLTFPQVILKSTFQVLAATPSTMDNSRRGS
jgi:hypothetical protein